MQNYIFESHQRFTQRRDWDVLYLPGDERVIEIFATSQTEEDARRKIIHRDFEMGIQTLKLSLLAVWQKEEV